jgi:hypothetical protein
MDVLALYFWLRLRPWYPRYAAALYALALLLPVFALLGFVQAGREVDLLIALDPDWIEELYDQTKVLRPDHREYVDSLRDDIIYGFWACLGAVLAARATRHAFERRRRIRIAYPDGRQVQVPRGFSVLEASRFAGIPHARFAAVAAAARPAAFESPARPRRCLPRAPPSKGCCNASARRPTCVWLANCGRLETYR